MYRDISEAQRVDIIRNGKEMSIQMPGELNMLNMLKAQPTFVQPLIPNQVDSVMPGSTADKMGLKKGHLITGIDGKAVASFNEFTDQLARHSDMLATAKTAADSIKARTVTISFASDSKQYTAKVVLHSTLKLGFVPVQLSSLYKPVTQEYGFFESFPAGVKYGCHVLGTYIDDLKYVFTAEGAKSLGGFGTIGNLFPADWDWYVFWRMTAFLSIILAFMNILPIPALDGGHVLFLLYEIITRRKPSEEFMIRAEYVGFGIVLLLLVVANLNDILRSLGIM
jgi:regulator of sigma E protease